MYIEFFKAHFSISTARASSGLSGFKSRLRWVREPNIRFAPIAASLVNTGGM